MHRDKLLLMVLVHKLAQISAQILKFFNVYAHPLKMLYCAYCYIVVIFSFKDISDLFLLTRIDLP